MTLYIGCRPMPFTIVGHTTKICDLFLGASRVRKFALRSSKIDTVGNCSCNFKFFLESLL